MRVSNAEASDETLARAIADNHDGDAEGELCRRFAPRIRSYGLRHLRDRAAADDLSQKVLLLTLQKLRAGAVRDPGQIASFILGSARLTAQSMRRAESRAAREPESVLREGAVEADAPIDRGQLARCLRELPERERSVIVRSFFQEEDAGHIASAMGLSAGNVRVIRHRALGRLRACLEPCEEMHA